MSLDVTLNALDTWLGQQAAPLSTPPRYKHSPPWPYAGDYPYLILMARDQTRERYSNAEVFDSGYIRIQYVDLVGRTYSSVGDLLAAAAAWHEAVAQALQSSERNRSLNGAVDYCGEGPEAPIVVRWDEKAAFLDTDNTPGWGVPIDIWIRGLPEPG